MKLENNSSHLSMVVPILLTLVPFIPFGLPQGLIYPITITFLLFLYQNKQLNTHFNKDFRSSILILLIYIGSISLSFYSGNSSILDFYQILKPIYFATLLLFGYSVAKKYSKNVIINGLLKSTYIIISFQVITSTLQLFDIPLLDFIYSAEKARPIGTITRVVGTMANPNTFAWFVIQSGIFIYLFEYNKLKKAIWLFIVSFLVILAGSRSMLVILPLAILITNFIRQPKDGSFYFKMIPTYLTLGIVTYILLVMFLENFGDYFPYLQQLLPILKGESLSSINSFGIREEIWSASHELFVEDRNILILLFGLGAGYIETVDNSYLYALYNTGIFGLIVILLLLVFSAYVFLKLKDRKFRALGLQYIILCLIIGVQSDAFAGWVYMSLLMYFMGIGIVWNEKEISKV